MTRQRSRSMPSFGAGDAPGRAPGGKRRSVGVLASLATRKPPKLYAVYLGILCRERGWPEPVAEAALIPGRRFRCDFSWEAQRLVVEVNGGAFIQGRHSRGMGQIKDWEKLNLLTLAGWRVLQATPKQVADGTLAELLAHVFTEAA